MVTYIVASPSIASAQLENSGSPNMWLLCGRYFSWACETPSFFGRSWPLKKTPSHLEQHPKPLPFTNVGYPRVLKVFGGFCFFAVGPSRWRNHPEFLNSIHTGTPEQLEQLETWKLRGKKIHVLKNMCEFCLGELHESVKNWFLKSTIFFSEILWFNGNVEAPIFHLWTKSSWFMRDLQYPQWYSPFLYLTNCFVCHGPLVLLN